MELTQEVYNYYEQYSMYAFNLITSKFNIGLPGITLVSPSVQPLAYNQISIPLPNLISTYNDNLTSEIFIAIMVELQHVKNTLLFNSHGASYNRDMMEQPNLIESLDKLSLYVFNYSNNDNVDIRNYIYEKRRYMVSAYSPIGNYNGERSLDRLLFDACCENDFSTMKELICHGANMNNLFPYAIEWATADKGYLDIGLLELILWEYIDTAYGKLANNSNNNYLLQPIKR